MTRPTLIIGCGHIGKRVANLLNRDDTEIFALSHSTDSVIKLQNLGLQVITGDLDQTDTLSQLPTAGANIYYFAPPPAKGRVDTRMRNFIASLNPETPPHRIIYISTTGVYGDCEGEWITEEAPLHPNNDRSFRRLDAESILTGFCNRSSTTFCILRVAGIYCAEKLPIDRLTAGMQVVQLSEAPSSNRIHADDLAQICVSAMQSSMDGEIFNVADGHPSSMTDYFIQISEVFDLPRPEEISWKSAQKTLSPAMLSYLQDSKKLDNSKLRTKLGIELIYPDLRSGLLAIKSQLQIS